MPRRGQERCVRVEMKTSGRADVVFGDRSEHKSHGLLVISKSLSASGTSYFSSRAGVHLVREFPSSARGTAGENISLVMPAVSG